MNIRKENATRNTRRRETGKETTMKITRIDIDGENGATGTIERKSGDNTIEVTIRTPRTGRFGVHRRIRTLTANTHYENEQFAVATALQEAMDGCHGTNSMIHDYYRLIQQLGD
jgi:hypothetical protein